MALTTVLRTNVLHCVLYIYGKTGSPTTTTISFSIALHMHKDTYSQEYGQIKPMQTVSTSRAATKVGGINISVQAIVTNRRTPVTGHAFVSET